jgi:tetratricopeptide (TPR) repeat protein
MQKANEDNVGAAYAAADTPEKLRAFIAAHPSDILASAAELRLADEAYQAKNYTAAAASYEKAAASKTAPFAGRALMGAAMSKILTGQTAEGETRLKQISNDTTQLPIIRGEATYHLATLAASAGQSAEALKLYKQVAEIAPATIWDENAAYQSEHLSASTAAPAAAQPATAQPASSSPEMPTIRFPQ